MVIHNPAGERQFEEPVGWQFFCFTRDRADRRRGTNSLPSPHSVQNDEGEEAESGEPKRAAHIRHLPEKNRLLAIASGVIGLLQARQFVSAGLGQTVDSGLFIAADMALRQELSEVRFEANDARIN